MVRQQCPQARILGVPIMSGDGVVTKAFSINTLVALLIRQATAITVGEQDKLIDVLCLSLGYYHEEPADAATDPMLRGLLKSFGSWGVAVVTSRRATTRPSRRSIRPPLLRKSPASTQMWCRWSAWAR